MGRRDSDKIIRLIQPVSAQAVAEKRASYTALLNSLGTATFSEIEATLTEREEVEPEPGLTPEVVARLRQRIAAKKQATTRFVVEKE